MSELADYTAVEHLRDGRPIEIRALRPDDRAEMLRGGRTDQHAIAAAALLRARRASRNRRWPSSSISISKIMSRSSRKSMKTDTPSIVGGGRYIVVRPGQAEIAFMVVDAYQGQGIGTDPSCGIWRFWRGRGPQGADRGGVAREYPMLKVFRKFGFRPGSKREPQVVHLPLQLGNERR